MMAGLGLSLAEIVAVGACMALGGLIVLVLFALLVAVILLLTGTDD